MSANNSIVRFKKKSIDVAKINKPVTNFAKKKSYNSHSNADCEL